MPASLGNVAIYRGDTTQFPVAHFTNSDDTDYDFTAEGWSDWVCQWEGRSGAKLDLDVTASDFAAGEIRVIADATTTAAMEESGTFDVQATHATDGVKTWLRGRTTLTKDITR